RTSLSYASMAGRTSTARYLLDKGADIHVKDDEGNSSLIYATLYAHQETIKLLIKRGADVRAKDSRGKTPLETA
ncbi:ankyrin, partial [Trichoderma longibrachiatum ATCC 18648]